VIELSEELSTGWAEPPVAASDVPAALRSEPVVEPMSPGGQGAVTTLADVERAHILRALTASRWRIAGPEGAGAVLGMHPNTLRHRMKKLKIER
jgi:transcriptional regulator with GAF, ATPase, and Fis domain